jgi:exodeoxyribonuclease VII small subunit
MPVRRLQPEPNRRDTMTDNEPAGQAAGPSYEVARDELVQIVQRLESGGAPLDEALTLWERGEELAAICQRWLDGAKAKIDAARPPAGTES